MRASTYSIVACDRDRAELGVAVQSKFLAIGALAAWVEADVGALATQAWINADYGPCGLRLLGRGYSPTETLGRLLAADEGRDRRQVGIVDAAGRAASYTGSGCLDWAGDRVGRLYAAQGNTLVSGTTVDALAETFEATRGEPLADRLLASLAAAQAAGGDRRGQQAAALRVARPGGGYGGFQIAVDLRVDDHAEPLRELERLYALHSVYFGSTPQREWIPVDEELRTELRQRLARLGYETGHFATDLETWAGIENLEERVRGVERLDPVVLAELRKR